MTSIIIINCTVFAYNSVYFSIKYFNMFKVFMLVSSSQKIQNLPTYYWVPFLWTYSSFTPRGSVLATHRSNGAMRGSNI